MIIIYFYINVINYDTHLVLQLQLLILMSNIITVTLTTTDDVFILIVVPFTALFICFCSNRLILGCSSRCSSINMNMFSLIHIEIKLYKTEVYMFIFIFADIVVLLLVIGFLLVSDSINNCHLIFALDLI